VGRYHHAAVDDATRVRALKTYKRHLQKSAIDFIDFIDYVVEKFPFLVQTIRADRSHEFCPLFAYNGNVDLEKKLAVRARFYNKDQPHVAHKGKTPYEVLAGKPS
jgi:hypothetical protein